VDSSPLRVLRNLSRGRQIVTVLINHGFDDVVQQMRLNRYLGWWRRVIRRQEPRPLLTRAQRIRLALEELGPTFVKFGQVASTRPDLVPANIVVELEKLQDHVPPFPGEVAVLLVEQELQGPITSLFKEFDPEPLAAGSLGQVHRAVHHDGTPLAVKIRRPDVVRDVERDLCLMLELAALIERHSPESEIFDPVGLVQQFARTIRREMSFAREGRTLDEFRRLFRDDATLFIPKVYWDLTSDAVLTMDFVGGMKVSDREGLIVAGIDPAAVAANGACIFMKMAFGFGLFHGDPHPGNIKVRPDGVIGLIDYGMVGRLEDEKREQLIDLLVAVTRGDVRQVTDHVLLIGKPFRPIDRPLLQADVRDFIDGYYGVPLDRLDVGKMLTDFVAILAHHGIRYPADLMLLIRAIITLEGVGRDLDPEFNLAAQLAPFMEDQVRQRYNPRRMAERIFADSQRLFHVFHDLPIHVGKTIDKLSRDDLKIQLEHRHLEHLITELDRSSNRLAIGLVMSALIVASALVLRTGGSAAWWVSIPTFILSSLLGMWLIYGVFRSGRL